MSSFCSFFSKKIQHTCICVSLDVNFNESLTNDVVSLNNWAQKLPKSKQYIVFVFMYVHVCISMHPVVSVLK